MALGLRVSNRDWRGNNNDDKELLCTISHLRDAYSQHELQHMC